MAILTYLIGYWKFWDESYKTSNHYTVTMEHSLLILYFHHRRVFMDAKQYTIFALDGEAVRKEYNIPITLEDDEPSHLESGVLNLYPDIEFQQIDGFGGAMTETTAYLYSKMGAASKKQFLEAHFGKDGQNYKFLRMHIDSCDYSLDEYQSVADPIEDPNFTTFSIERDKKYVLPMLKDAMDMTTTPFSVLLSPWSPPKQWKTPPIKPKNDASVYGGMMEGMFGKIDYDTPSRCNGGSLKPEHYDDWAGYLVKFVQAYLDEGVPVTMMTLQNETIASTNWDSCVWTAQEQRTFLKDSLYPAFHKAGLTDKVGLYIWDHNKERIVEFARAIIDDETYDMVQGIAFHWYSGDHFEALEMTRSLYPDKILISSECCALHPPGTSSPLDKHPILASMLGGSKFPASAEYDDAVAYAHDIIGNLNAGMNRWIDWNLCVDKDGGPRHVSSGFGAPVCANEDGTYRKLLTFDYIGQFSKYILPEAKRIGFSRCDADTEITVAKNLDNSIVMVALNVSGKDKKYAIRMNGKLIRIALASKTLSTIIIE